MSEKVISKFFEHNGKPKLRLSTEQLIARKKILDNINLGKYVYEHSTCPICELNTSNILLTTDKYGIETHIHECVNCALVYNKLRFDKETLFDIYKNHYRRIEKPPENTSAEQLFELGYWKGNNIYNIISKHVNKGLVVEIGCGSGGILKFFKEKGYEVIGYDLDEKYLNYGRNLGLDLKSGEFDFDNFGKEISVIILEQCLEHIIDINHFLSGLSKVCGKNTIVYIGVPGIRNIHANYFGNVLEYFAFYHLYHFDKNSLTKIMKKHSFSPFYIDDLICSVFSKSDIKFTDFIDQEPIKNYLINTFKRWRLNWYKKLAYRILKYPFKKLRKN